MKNYFQSGVKNIFRSLGYDIHRSRNVSSVAASVPYCERAEVGPKNLQVKLARLAAGGPFEWPDIVALNNTVGSMAAGAKSIVELGGGTGCFAYNIAKDPSVQVICSEFDVEVSHWAKANRARPNIDYVSRPVSPSEGPFDLCVSIEVIEHVSDYRGFIEACASLAPRVILTTPNKLRNEGTATAGPPPYHQHVREWSAGEFYWVLRTFFPTVNLFALSDPMKSDAIPIDVMSVYSPLIAVCEGHLCAKHTTKIT